MKVFISHSSTDKKFARTLKDDLNENSFSTWLDEDEIDFGDKLIDKLETALEESSHFLIILSPASVNSEWVKFELTKALNKNETHLLKKIIPIKYSSCEVPRELQQFLYADLTAETRRVHGEKVFFVTPGYDNFLNKLCKTIRNSDNALTSAEKVKIKEELIQSPFNDALLVTGKVIKGIYTVKGYTSRDSKLKYSNRILANAKQGVFETLEEIRPVLLPPLLQSVLSHLKFGDSIYISKNYAFNEVGHFAGYRTDDVSFTIDRRIRDEISLQKGLQYNVEIDPAINKINFIDR